MLPKSKRKQNLEICSSTMFNCSSVARCWLPFWPCRKITLINARIYSSRVEEGEINNENQLSILLLVIPKKATKYFSWNIFSRKNLLSRLERARHLQMYDKMIAYLTIPYNENVFSVFLQHIILRWATTTISHVND